MAFDEDFEAEMHENHEAGTEVSLLAQSAGSELTEVKADCIIDDCYYDCYIDQLTLMLFWGFILSADVLSAPKIQISWYMLYVYGVGFCQYRCWIIHVGRHDYIIHGFI